MILILGQLIEYYIEKIFMEKFGCSMANFRPQTVLLTRCCSLHFILYEPKPWNEVGSQSLAKHLIRVRT